MISQIEIRPLRPDERADWEALWTGYQNFYNRELSAELNGTTWRRLNDPAEPMHLLGGYVDGELSGIVHFIYLRSTWTIADYCYLQDVFVSDEARNQGLGGAMVEAVCESARAAGASWIFWLTHSTNLAAQSLYDQIAERSGFIQYRKRLS